MDWLPAGVVLDPAQVEVTVVDGRGQVVEVRDDGRIVVQVGHDANNAGVLEYGRVNAGSAAVHDPDRGDGAQRRAVRRAVW